MADYFTASRRWNLAHGCQHASVGCGGCWAERMATRHRDASARGGHWTDEVVLFPERLGQPLHWRKPALVCVQFMGDLFYERVLFEYVAAVFGVMAACLQHTFLLLTKRPERMLEFHRWLDERGGLGKYLRSEAASGAVRVLFASGSRFELYRGRKVRSSQDAWARVLNAAACGPSGENVWAGISAENQTELEKRWRVLSQVPAAHHWWSLEPLLGPLDFSGDVGAGVAPAFVAVGPETGPGRRPCRVEWLQSVVDQCAGAGVACHVKAVPVDGRISHDPAEWPESLRCRQWPEVFNG